MEFFDFRVCAVLLEYFVVSPQNFRVWVFFGSCRVSILTFAIFVAGLDFSSCFVPEFLGPRRFHFDCV